MVIRIPKKDLRLLGQRSCLGLETSPFKATTAL
jgi:hypothetical protein